MRCFRSIDEIKKRYGELLDFIEFKQILPYTFYDKTKRFLSRTHLLGVAHTFGVFKHPISPHQKALFICIAIRK
jgi:hypothetical protein